MNRRGFLTGLIAAPAVILTPGLLMPVRKWIEPAGNFVKFFKNGHLVGMAPLMPFDSGFNYQMPPEYSTFRAGDIVGIELPDMGSGEYRAIAASSINARLDWQG
jgi:hypothetical protein